MKEELEVYKDGLVFCSVCTNIKSRKRIEEVVNLKNPTGIKSQWRISNDPFRKGNPFGEKSGCPCEKKPKTHRHYLLEC